MKTCSKCRVPKPLVDFYVDKSKLDGHQYACKECRRIRSHRKRSAGEEVHRKSWLLLPKTTEQNRKKRRRRTLKLADWYIRKKLRDAGFTAPICPGLIDLKREQLILRRLAKQLKQAITERSK